MHWHVVQTLFQEMKSHHNPKGWIHENKNWVLIGSWNIFVWSKRSWETELSLWAETILIRGLEFLMDQIEFVIDLNNDDTEILDDQYEAHALQLDAKDFACRSKAKAKAQRREYLSTEFGQVLNQRNMFSDHWSVEEMGLSSSSWKITWRRRSTCSILENWRNSAEIFPMLSSLVWQQVEWEHGRRRKLEKIPVLYWFIRSNLVFRSCSRSFRTQSHWSLFTGPCDYSEQLLPVHVSYRMCNQLRFHHQSGVDIRKFKIWGLKRQYSFSLWVPETRVTRIVIRSSWVSRVMHNESMHKAWKRHQNGGVLGRHQSCSEERIEALYIPSSEIPQLQAIKNRPGFPEIQTVQSIEHLDFALDLKMTFAEQTFRILPGDCEEFIEELSRSNGRSVVRHIGWGHRKFRKVRWDLAVIDEYFDEPDKKLCSDKYVCRTCASKKGESNMTRSRELGRLDTPERMEMYA